MVKLIDKSTYYYKTQCHNCASYLVYERMDEEFTKEDDTSTWWIECPNCKKQTPTYKIIDGQVFDYIMKK